MDLPAWFGLGDRDLATHLYRTEMLRRRKSLTDATESIGRIFGLRSKILPATDDEVKTIISTSRGKMHLQEFWVKHGAKPAVIDITFRGADNAKPTRKVVDSIRNSERIILAPANPISSIGPMLAIPNIRRELKRFREKVVAVSPIIGNRPVGGPAAKYMKALGLEVSPVGVAGYYRGIASSLVIAKTDRRIAGRIGELGVKPVEADIMMTSRASEKRLARYLAKKVQN